MIATAFGGIGCGDPGQHIATLGDEPQRLEHQECADREDDDRQQPDAVHAASPR